MSFVVHLRRLKHQLVGALMSAKTIAGSHICGAFAPSPPATNEELEFDDKLGYGSQLTL